MANEFTSSQDNTTRNAFEIDASQVEILMTGFIADDDLMWVVRCSVKELQRMFLSPTEWVAALGKHPRWQEAGTDRVVPAPVLTRDFVMLVQETKAVEADGWVTIQGIGGTNAITVIASRASGLRSVLSMDKIAATTAERLGTDAKSLAVLSDADLIALSTSPYAAFWDEVAYDASNAPSYKKPFPVNVVLSNASFYGHFEILNPNDTPADRAARSATFALACALDPEGYAAMLGSLDQRTTYVDGGTVTLGDAIDILPPTNPTVVYGNVEDGGTGQSTTTVCSLIAGPYEPPTQQGETGTGTLDGILIKRYGVEGGTPIDPE